MGIFFVKMAISIAPVIFMMDKKVVNAVIMQLENETKSEKDSTDKEDLKEKKAFDEYYSQFIRIDFHVFQINSLHNQENLIYHNIFYPVVPTPPPNV